MYKIELLDLSEIGIKQCAQLLKDVYPSASHLNEKYIQWQYNLNPEGRAVGFNAWSENEMAAHYVTIPLKATIAGKAEKGLLSLNTATDVNHRGKGLFTKLADATYQYATENGYQFVIGVANTNSTHGFTKKLGFQLVSPLDAMIGLGNIPTKKNKVTYEYERIWTDESLAWRLDNSIKQYIIKQGNDWKIYCNYKYRIPAIIGTLDGSYQLNAFGNTSSLLKLWIGIDDNLDWKKSFYFNIPSKLRPAPLNLIFKDLTGQNRQLRKETTKFQLIDFDVL